jgi:hypothetical protein
MKCINESIGHKLEFSYLNDEWENLLNDKTNTFKIIDARHKVKHDLVFWREANEVKNIIDMHSHHYSMPESVKLLVEPEMLYRTPKYKYLNNDDMKAYLDWFEQLGEMKSQYSKVEIQPKGMKPINILTKDPIRTTNVDIAEYTSGEIVKTALKDALIRETNKVNE